MKKLLLLSIFLYLVSLVSAQVNQKQITIESTDQFLNFPVKRSNEQTMARVIIDGEVYDEFSLKLAAEDPDFWTFLDVSRFQGKNLTVEVDNGDIAEEALEMVNADARFPGQDSLYKEKYRQQVHFSSRRGWNNDPNGLVYYKGEYHLFYQHNPFGWNWGNMHWGHAVSKDLIHWKELPNALYLPDHDHMAFSGSAIIADQNTSGFSKNGIDPIVAAYTRTGRGESLALSYDKGRTFTEFEGKPVVEHQGRDPKVFWYEPGGHWVMVVYDYSYTHDIGLGEKATIQQHSIYTSPDLKNWTYQSGVPGFFECPELFEINVEGEPGVKKWVIYGADGKYMVGDFNGKEFKVEQPLTKYDYGGHFYASQMFNNVPDGRKIQIGWFQIETKGMPFNQCMTVPMKLELKKKHGNYLLTPMPIKEFDRLHDKSSVYEEKIITPDNDFVAHEKGDMLHVIAEFKLGDSHSVGLNINGYEMVYNHLRGNFNGTHYKIPYDQELKVEVIVDKSSMEIFVNDGELYYAVPHNNVKADKIIEAFALGNSSNKVVLKKMEVYELESIW